MAKGKILSKIMRVKIKIGAYGWECPALENLNLKALPGNKSINDWLNDGWSLAGIEPENLDVHTNPLKNAKKTTAKGDLTDSDKFFVWYGIFTKPYPRM